uniref:Uncharacterized protein n=2 Tax=Sar TaxID=2698737 RepID=A0A7S3PGE8_9STRA|mmetsp:Transcript_5631/g.7134  ORF Transcript_5631/g.7134 Transcript_5631/m.7134 type:complete len:162 (-) Transcript_5631:424-909(-)|eukprot:CAMPEP_0204826980 /NCGR_PEP_ID=MMETSP1346-20131115/4552_1 /ASSEMBLY_ACC=CAM_ASM_000771 /TAXON_ID=215587 /ORGANISM="Aplanochytrium stocchinoi, Strain GSBS06" /LENGTH=161 /DNA_ID=CAMNT_0051955241 /DNA_START=218 /DNA_END=703 /DNA_ORIENTATION=-
MVSQNLKLVSDYYENLSNVVDQLWELYEKFDEIENCVKDFNEKMMTLKKLKKLGLLKALNNLNSNLLVFKRVLEILVNPEAYVHQIFDSDGNRPKNAQMVTAQQYDLFWRVRRQIEVKIRKVRNTLKKILDLDFKDTENCQKKRQQLETLLETVEGLLPND